MVTPEERAADLVVVTCRPCSASHCVELRGPGLAPVTVCHFPNPALARETVNVVRAFVAAIIRDSDRKESPGA